MTHEDVVLFGRVGLAFLLCYAVGFERGIRGAPAGDRTFSLVGTAAAAIFAATGIGVVAGTGHAWLAVFVALLTLLDLELRHLPVLNRLEAHRYSDRMANDAEDDDNDAPTVGPFGGTG